MVPAFVFRFGPGSGCGVERIIGPMVFWVAAFEVFFDFVIAALPEAGQVLGHLYRAAGR